MGSKRHTQINFEALRPNQLRSNPSVLGRGHVKRAWSLDNRATRLKQLELVAALSRTKALTAVKHGCPWEKYEKNYDFRVFVDDDTVVVAEVKDPWTYDVPLAEQQRPSPFVVTVRTFPEHKAEQKLCMLQQIQHENIVSVREIFNYKESIHVISEHMPISLHHVGGMLKHITEPQLASILGQGSSAEGLEHGSLKSTNILVNAAGDVKIAMQECCHKRADTEPRDIRALNSITMELMRLKDGGRWPSDSKAVGFLSETTSATSVEGLMKHPLFSLPWGNENLQGLADLALISVFRGYKWPPSCKVDPIPAPT